jgi:hypothetical protein
VSNTEVRQTAFETTRGSVLDGADLMQIHDSHRGSQTSAAYLLTATKSATCPQRHGGFRTTDSSLVKAAKGYTDARPGSAEAV